MLFDVLEKYPVESMSVLIINENMDRNYILDQIEQPISDNIDIETVSKTIQEVDHFHSLKAMIINRLGIAGLKNQSSN